ncbi:class I SAM-dependent methyltransferase [Bradyrhizobium sp. Arg62]|uniref:class I SAM-dependent methyltransferase n=1 Tax=Bradyrhizobium brasilense TaxID=1419277 RepID=UPI001E548F65|nr:class I SAM-dependent methyltransferase [Bradyrhizobium brasilense]MCC8945698.1 class I SAM-dependent methyltransferase [Bradyrhizobium brasilense]
MTDRDWQEKLEAFFELRARQISEVPTLDDLCYLAGRNPLLWTDQNLLSDLKSHVLDLMQLDQTSKVLEVGCAAGLLASLIAPKVGKYVGIDLAETPLSVARRLKLANAEFRKGDGQNLPFGDREFDAALCYDVFSNFPAFETGEKIIREMLRVVRSGGRVLVGSIPDRNEIEQSQQISARLAAGFGTQQSRPPLQTLVKAEKAGPLARLSSYLGLTDKDAVREIKPEIVSYYFSKDDFVQFGSRLQVETRIADIHPRNPYAGTRFNVIFTAK